jgi:hypothetical protein
VPLIDDAANPNDGKAKIETIAATKKVFFNFFLLYHFGIQDLSWTPKINLGLQNTVKFMGTYQTENSIVRIAVICQKKMALKN